MLLLRLILRITGFNLEEFAQYLDVSQNTVYEWFQTGVISDQDKGLIANKFSFPLVYFSVSLKDKEVYEVVYATIAQHWKKSSLSEEAIMDGLCRAYNPFTGEVFDSDHILNHPEVKKLMCQIKNKYYKFGTDVSYQDLSREQKITFHKLKEWRMGKSIQEGYDAAYMVFTDKELYNIVCANIEDKEDLLGVKGFGSKKYLKYGDDIYHILMAS